MPKWTMEPKKVCLYTENSQDQHVYFNQKQFCEKKIKLQINTIDLIDPN